MNTFELNPDLLSEEVRSSGSVSTVTDTVVLLANLTAELSLLVPEKEFAAIRGNISDTALFLSRFVAPLVTPAPAKQKEEVVVPKKVKSAKPLKVAAPKEEPAPAPASNGNPKLQEMLNRINKRLPVGAKAMFNGIAQANAEPEPEPEPEPDQLRNQQKGVEPEPVEVEVEVDSTPAPAVSQAVEGPQVLDDKLAIKASAVPATKVPVGLRLDIGEDLSSLSLNGSGEDLSDYAKAVVVATLWTKEGE